MAQPQYQQAVQPPASPFSPPQSATSTASSQQFPLPPSKRQRLSPGAPSQPTSPYSQSPYSLNQGLPITSPTNPSSHFPNISIPSNVYTTPYGNKPATPQTPQPQTPTPAASGHIASPLPQNLQPSNIAQSPGAQIPQPQRPPSLLNTYQQPPTPGSTMTPQPPGVMGPPQKPPEKPNKEHESVDGAFDVLAGSGIDLRWEENFTLSYAFDPKAPVTSSAQSFHQFPPGDRTSFYGAGPANQPGEPVADGKSQTEMSKEAAEKAWQEAARKIAKARDSEVRNPRVLIAPLWKKMETIAKEHGLELLTDKTGKMGDFNKPLDHIDPDRSLETQGTVTTKTILGPNGAMMETHGRFLPEKSPLIDQLALVSLATNQQLKSLVADAARLARGRQAGSHGSVPEDWADAAAPSSGPNGTVATMDSPRFGWESAVSPLTNPLKQSLPKNKLPTPTSDGPTTPKGNVTFTNDLVSALRSSAKTERNLEEMRLLKRQNRANPDAASRTSSIAPGTPGSVAPEPEKAPTKKEQKQQAKAKMSEAETHLNANKTTNQFLGGGRAMFGKKRKTYSWMTGGDGGGSGASTPGRLTTSGLPGTPGVSSNVKQTLTSEGTNRLGSFREDKEKGQGLQLRDWVAVLESAGKEVKSLQTAYALLDKSAK